MSDLWADARLNIIANRDQALDLESEMIVVPAKVALKAFDEVKVDADALLAVVKEIETIMNWNMAEHHGSLPSWVPVKEALAALPEHLHCGTKAGDS
jgi:hypothetical protein